MKIAKQGYRFIIGGLVVGAAGIALGRLGLGFGPLGLAFAAFSAFFFRDPERALPSDPDKIYSPADGRVLSVAREGSGDVVTMRIFLSIFDVHVQRFPCSGKVGKIVHQPGGFAMAMDAEARTNERCAMRIDPGGGREPLTVEQIAGYIARRIECWPAQGDPARAGERYGIIYFGSQAAVYFPKGSLPTAKPGDVVCAGLTEIGLWTA